MINPRPLDIVFVSFLLVHAHHHTLEIYRLSWPTPTTRYNTNAYAGPHSPNVIHITFLFVHVHRALPIHIERWFSTAIFIAFIFSVVRVCCLRRFFYAAGCRRQPATKAGVVGDSRRQPAAHECAAINGRWWRTISNFYDFSRAESSSG